MLRAMTFIIAGIILIALSGFNLSQAADKTKKKVEVAPSPSSTSSPSSSSTSSSSTSSGMDAAEKVNVESIKEKYWARGDEAEMGVVQNRLYTKAGKFEVGVTGGVLLTDPFINVYTLNATFGYHIDEYFSTHLVWAKALSSTSSALSTLSTIGSGYTTNYNAPGSLFLVEGNASFLYGKLSLFSKSIIYYDMYLSGGLGRINTESAPLRSAGNGYAAGATLSQSFLTENIGIGQRFYLSKMTSIRFDYRLMHFSETLIESQSPTASGVNAGTRSNWSHSITLGVDILFGGSSP